MITQAQIEAYVESKSGTCLEVFSSIVGTKSKATRDSVILSAEAVCLKILEPLGNASVTKASSAKIASKSMDLDTLLCLALDVDNKIRNQGFVKLLLKIDFTRNLAIRLTSFLLDLDYSRLKVLQSSDRGTYEDVGDAIFLAGFYLALQQA